MKKRRNPSQDKDLNEIARLLATGIVRMKTQQMLLSNRPRMDGDPPPQGITPLLSTRSVDKPDSSTVIRASKLVTDLEKEDEEKDD